VYVTNSITLDLMFPVKTGAMMRQEEVGWFQEMFSQ
jgi:hypothetical protein